MFEYLIKVKRRFQHESHTKVLVSDKEYRAFKRSRSSTTWNVFEPQSKCHWYSSSWEFTCLECQRWMGTSVQVNGPHSILKVYFDSKSSKKTINFPRKGLSFDTKWWPKKNSFSTCQFRMDLFPTTIKLVLIGWGNMVGNRISLKILWRNVHWTF